MSIPAAARLPGFPFPAWDDSLFVRANGVWHAPWLDPVMRAITLATSNTSFVIAFWALVCALLWRRPAARATWTLCLMAVGMSDLLIDRVLKPLVHRPRPIEAGLPIRALTDLPRTLGFPSGHASNFAALAMVLTLRRSPWALPAWVFTLIVGWSRVYVGVHRPVDVLAGWVFGSMVGVLVGRWLLRLLGWRPRRPAPPETPPPR